ncbi:MAG: hypothetical protein PHF00_01080, partial [Elusimicrobia bacterium]|nr:hypothetical protein [Elusimicrobiota bacterium]
DQKYYKVTSRVKDRADNRQLVNLTTNTFSADLSAPVSKVTLPLHGLNYESLSQVAGTAQDAGAAGVSRVYLAYYRATGGAQNWWSKSAKDFILPNAAVPPDAAGPGSDYWVEASSDNNVPVNWYATGVSTPNWAMGNTYEVLAVAVDKVQNAEAKRETAASNTSRSQFTTNAPNPVSRIIKPSVMTPHFQSAAATLNGTANAPYATVVEAQLWDVTDGGNVLAWRASDEKWVSSAVFPDWNPTQGGVASWTFSILQASWTSLHYYQLRSRAGTPYEAGQGPNYFYIDDGAPLAGVIMPDVTFKNNLPQLAGTATDDSAGLAGAAKTVYFRLRRMEEGSEQFWSTAVSTFVAAPGIDCVASAHPTCLAPNVGDQPPNTFAVAHASFTDKTAFEAGRQYTAQIVAKDAAGNSKTESKNFTWDIVAPQLQITSPTASSPVRSLPGILGTAADGFSFHHSSVSLRSLYNGKCYSNVSKSFTADCPFWVATSSAPDNPPLGAYWQYADADLNTALSLHNTWFVLLAKGMDTARNENNDYAAGVSSRTFIFDDKAPDVVVTFPAHLVEGASPVGRYKPGGIGGAAHPFTGTAADPNSPWNAGVRKVEINISYQDGGGTWRWVSNQWTSGTYANDNRWLATIDDTWYSEANPTWGAGVERQYRIEARAEDASYLADGTASGNTSVPATVGADIRDFIVDDAAPLLGLTQPAAPEAPALAAIAGTADGGLSGLARVELRVQRIAGGADEDWTGSSWTALTDHYSTATFTGTLGELAWNYDDLVGALQDDEVYRLYARATDWAGNVYSASSYDFRVDAAPPTLAISFPASPPPIPPYSNDAVNSEATRISTYTWGTISDSGDNPSGVTEVWVAMSSGTSENVWWTTAPAAGFTVNQGNIHWSTNVYRSGAKWVYAPAEWRAPGFSDGVTYKVFVRARDKAGNWTSEVSNPATFPAAYKQAFKFDVTRPTATASGPANGSENGSALASLGGQGTDSGEGLSGVAYVYAAVQHVYGAPIGELGKYWDWTSGFTVGSLGAPPGAGWVQVASSTLYDQASVAWSTPVPAGMLTSSNTYRVVAVALDQATNLQQNPAAAGAGATFHYDTQLPTAAFTAPAAPPAPAVTPYFNAANLAATAMAGTANDEATGAAGLASVQILLKAETSGATWNGGTSGTTDDWDYTGSKNTQWRTVSGNLTAWTKSLPPMPSDFDSRRMRLWVRAADRAGNQSPTPSDGEILSNDNPAASGGGKAWTFTYDNAPPMSGVTAPPRYFNTAPTSISGTSADQYDTREPSGVYTMFLRYQRSSTTKKFWSQVADDWLDTDAYYYHAWDSNGNPWSFTIVGNGPFEDGYEYGVNSRARDAAGNSEPVSSTYTFIVDRSTPISKPSFPAHNGFTSGTTISGTADDFFCALKTALCDQPYGGRHFQSGIEGSSVTVAVERVSDGWWWDGDSFENTGAPVWSTAAFVGDSSGTWTYALPGSGALVSPNNYRVSSRVLRDRAGNVESAITTNTFTYDTGAPVALATAPTGSVGAAPFIYGTARDEAPGVLDVVRLRLQEANDCNDPDFGCHMGQYWNGKVWQSQEVWLSSGEIGGLIVDSTYSWKWDTNAPAGPDRNPVAWDNQTSYWVTVRGIDKANNIENLHAVMPDITFRLETPDATASFTKPPAPNGLHYGPNTAGNVTNLLGEGNNMKLTAGIKLYLQRLTAPTSYWNDVAHVWTDDSAVYTPVDVQDGSPQIWSHSLNGPYTVANAQYELKVIPVNNADQAGAPATRSFVFDKVTPAGQILSPSGAACGGADACVNGWPNLSGTFQDSGSVDTPSIDISSVGVRIKRVSDGTYWNGADFTGTLSEVAPPSLGYTAPDYSWSTATLVAALDKLNDGEKYSVIARAMDKAGNEMGGGSDENQMARFTVLYDTSPATAYLVGPSSGEVYMSLAQLSGTAGDRYGTAKDAGVDRAEISIRYPFDDVCWSETNMQFNVACPHFFTVGPSPWTYAEAALTGQLTSGRDYTVTVRAVDKAANVQTSFAIPASSRTFYVDKNPPTAGFTKPVSGQSYPATGLTGGSALTGTAADPEKTHYPFEDALQPGKHLVIWYLLGDTSYYYTGVPNKYPSCNGTKFSSNTVEGSEWQDVASTDSWTFLFQSGDWISDRQYYAKVRARDRARIADGSVSGNLMDSFTPGVSLIDFKVDNTAPTSQTTAPVDGSFIKDWKSLGGTANSDLSGANTYYLRLWYVVGVSSYYWNGAGTWRDDLQTNLPVSVVGATGTVAWSYPSYLPTPTIDQADGRRYGVCIQAKDNAGNLNAGTTSMVTLDQGGPTVKITTPTPANLYYGGARPLIEVRGTSYDTPAGVAQVKIQLANVSDVLKWDGDSWEVFDSTWLVALATDPWHLDIATWTYNKAYTIQAHAKDLVGTDQQAEDSVTNFIYDVNTPSSTIQAPSAAVYQSTPMVASLRGTAVDWLNAQDSAKSGLSAVQVKIVEVASGWVYDGADFTSGDVESKWRATSLSLNGRPQDEKDWTYPSGGDVIPNWQNGLQYRVYSRARDATGNTESAQMRQFTYDIKAPTTTVTAPPAGFVVSVSSFYGPFNDALGGVSRVQIAVRREDGAFWDGAGFNITCAPTCAPANPYLNAVVHQDSWSYTNTALASDINGQPNPVSYKIFVAGTDAAWNINRSTTAAPAGDGDRSFSVDHVAPTSISTWPAAAYTQGPVTPVAGTARDGFFSGASGLFAVKIKLLKIDNAGTTYYYGFLSGSWPEGEDAPSWHQVPLAGGSGETVGAWSAGDADSVKEADFGEGYLYKLVSRAEDNLSPPNVEVNVTTISFIVDRSTPVLSIDTPYAASTYISSSTLVLSSGPYQEQPAGMVVSGLEHVMIQLQDISAGAHSIPDGNAWWGGGVWQGAAPAEEGDVHSGYWSYSDLPGTADWVRGDASPDGRQYVLRVMGADRAGNSGTFPNILTALRSLTFDSTRPRSLVIAPAGPTTTGLGTISGTAADVEVNDSSSGVRAVWLSVRNDPLNAGDPDAGKYWNGASWQFGNYWNPANFNPANGQWSFSSPPLDVIPNVKIDSNYNIVSSVTDRAGNFEPAPPDESASNYREVIYQPPPSVTGVDIPESLAAYNQLIAMQGPANTPESIKMNLQLKRHDTGQCGGGLAPFAWVDCAQSTATRVIYPEDGAWLYPPAGEQLPNWPALNNTTFTLRTAGINSAGQVENAPWPSGALATQFYVDMTSPAAGVGFPSDGGFINSTPTLSGTISDPSVNLVAAGMKDPNGVNVRLVRVSDGSCWDQTAGNWAACPKTSTAAYAAGTWSLSVNRPDRAWGEGWSYQVDVQGMDKAKGGVNGNISVPVPSPALGFTYDTLKPTVSLGNPNLPREKNLTDIIGAAADTAPGQLKKVEVRVQKKTGSEYYLRPGDPLLFDLDPGVEDVETSWIKANYDGPDWTNWKLSSGIPWISGVKYIVMVRSQDKAGSYSIPYTTYPAAGAFVYDTDPPQSGVTAPGHGSTVKALSAIEGTLTDYPLDTGNGYSSGTVIVQRLRFERLDLHQCWDGSGWVACPGYIQTEAAGMQLWQTSWTIKAGNLPSGANLTSGVSYYLACSGTDNAADGGNTENPFHPRGSTFTFDDTAGYAGISAPKHGAFFSSLASFSGASSDNVEVSTISLSLRDASAAGPNNCYSEAGNNFTAACPGWFPGMGTVGSWSYGFAVQPWARDHFYVLLASATDQAGNMQVNVSSAGFTYDIGVATAALTTPAAAYLNDETPELVGTSTDSTSGIGTVELAFSDNGGLPGTWLTGLFGTFTGGAEAWIGTSTVGGYTLGSANDTWRRGVTGISFQNGKTYLVRLRANDKALPPNSGGFNGTYRDYSVLYDNARPTASISDPVNGVYKKANFTISGGSSDPDPDGGGPLLASNVSTVTIQLEKLGTGGSCYKPGTGFGEPCPYFFPAFGTPAAWTFTVGANPFTDGAHYMVLARATDNAGKVQDVFAAGTSSNVFVYDEGKPQVGWTTPGSARYRQLALLTGTASDAAPGVLKKVELRARRETGQQRYLRPSNLIFEETDAELAWIKATYLANWTDWRLSSAVPWVSGEKYYVMARSLDDAGNYSVPYSTYGVGAPFVFDDTPPQTGVEEPAPQDYVNTLPKIAGTLIDYPLEGGIGLSSGTVVDVKVRMQRLDTNQCWDGASWQACPQTMATPTEVDVWATSWTLKSGNIPSGVNLKSGTSFYITSWGTDDAVPGGNTESVYHVRGSTFWYDASWATATIVSPLDARYYSTLASFSGASSDNVEVSTISLSLRDASAAGPNNCYSEAGNNFTA